MNQKESDFLVGGKPRSRSLVDKEIVVCCEKNSKKQNENKRKETIGDYPIKFALSFTWFEWPIYPSTLLSNWKIYKPADRKFSCRWIDNPSSLIKIIRGNCQNGAKISPSVLGDCFDGIFHVQLFFFTKTKDFFVWIFFISSSPIKRFSTNTQVRLRNRFILCLQHFLVFLLYRFLSAKTVENFFPTKSLVIKHNKNNCCVQVVN